MRERERRERDHPSFSLRSSEFHQSKFVEPRVTVHLLDEGYVYIPKKRDFTMLQEVGIIPTLVYFHPNGCFSSISTLRSRLALFYALRGCLAWVKTTLITILRPVCGRFCVLICGCV